MLAFLDRLCAALLARDSELVRRLLEHPLARALPRQVREEAQAIARGGGACGHRAPLHALRLYHQTAHLLGAVADPAHPPRGAAREVPVAQIELPLLDLPATRRRRRTRPAARA